MLKSSCVLGLPALSDAALVAFYAPYCGGLEQEPALRGALGVLRLGTLRGSRAVKGRAAYQFSLSWSEAKAPLEPLACCLTFPHHPDLRYEFEVVSQQLVVWLMQRDDNGKADLPDSFWRWLLTGADPTSDHA